MRESVTNGYGQVVEDWGTHLCREPDQQDGNGFFTVYNADAGIGEWFMKYGVRDGYQYASSRFNELLGTHVWFRWPEGNPSAVEIAVTPMNESTPRAPEPLAQYYQDDPKGAVLTAQYYNTARGILAWNAQQVYELEQYQPNPPPANVVRTAQANAMVTAANQNHDAYARIYADTQAGDETADEMDRARELESYLSEPEANLIASIEAAPCDPSFNC